MRPSLNKMNSWVEFKGFYDKHECDIMLKDGTIIYYCWPNSGSFTVLGDDGKGQIFKGDEVAQIRYKDYFKKLKGE